MSKKRHKNTLNATFEVFDYDVCVVVAEDIGKAMLRFPETENEECFKNIDALTIHCGGDDYGKSFIFFKPGVSLGTVAHEAWHVVEHMLTEIDEDSVDGFHGETVAYHLGYLVDKISPLFFVRKKGAKVS